tara:strand:- start:22468 stop:22746 length:279 start_codon:yes stop_codon:yes gene_type:complete
MNYSLSNNDALEIQIISSGELTLTKKISSTEMLIKGNSYIKRMVDSNGNEISSSSYCEIDDNKPIIKNNINSISIDTDNEITIQLNTKFKRI